MATNITTLKNAEKTENLIPRTQIKAIFDKDGQYLDQNLKASDLNPLKNGAIGKMVRVTDAIPDSPIPLNADQLGGHDASYFATAEALSSLSSDVTALNTSTSITFTPDTTRVSVADSECRRIGQLLWFSGRITTVVGASGWATILTFTNVRLYAGIYFTAITETGEPVRFYWGQNYLQISNVSGGKEIRLSVFALIENGY